MPAKHNRSSLPATQQTGPASESKVQFVFHDSCVTGKIPLPSHWLGNRIWGDRNVVAYPLPDRAGARGRAAGLLPALVVLRGWLFPGVEKINTRNTRVLAAGEYSQARARRGPPSVREFCQLLPAGLPGIRDHFCSGRSG